MNYTPKEWTNTTLGPLFTKMLEANNTVSKNLVRVLDDIKNEQVVTSISGTLVDQAYAVNPVSAGDITFGDTVITPAKRQYFHTFTMDALRSTRFGRDMAAGASNMDSNEFINAVLEFYVPNMGLAIEKRFWTSLNAQLAVHADVKKLNGAAVTAANVVATFEKIYEELPSAILNGNETKIYVPHSVKQAIRLANVKAAYRDIFEVSDASASYLGVPIEFAPTDAIVAGRWSDLILGTDLVSDFNTLEVGKVNNTGDEMFIKATYSLASAVCVPDEKVIYTIA